MRGIRRKTQRPAGKRTRKQKGSATVETALVVSVFVLMITGIIDYATYLHARSRLQWAVSQAARYAVTGNSEDDKGLSRTESIEHILEKRSGIDFDDDDIEIFSVDEAGAVSRGPGDAGDIVVVRVSWETSPITPAARALFPDGKLPIRVTARFKNEEFSK